MITNNMGTWRHRWRAPQWVSWILKQMQLIPILREEMPFRWVWLFQTKINEKFAWIKCPWLNSSSTVNSIIISHLILHVLKVANSVENQNHYKFSSFFFFKLLRKSIFKNVWEGLIDSSTGKGTCCQANSLSLIPRIHIMEGENQLLKGNLWPPCVWHTKSYGNYLRIF